MRYILEIKSQHSKGSSSNHFGGPDTYVAVQCVPDDVESLTSLNHKVAAKRGIKIVHFGEGYRKHAGPRSALGQAIKRAKDFIAKKEQGERIRTISRYMAAPHGLCERAGYCVEHEQNPKIEACR